MCFSSTLVHRDQYPGESGRNFKTPIDRTIVACRRVSARVVACHRVCRVASSRRACASVRVCCVEVGRGARASWEASQRRLLCQAMSGYASQRAPGRARPVTYTPSWLCTPGMQHAVLMRRSLARVRGVFTYLSYFGSSIILMFLVFGYGLPVL